MRLKDLKEKLDQMTEEQLQQGLIVVATGRTQSGYSESKISQDDLIYTGDDDPCELQTRAELIEDGYDEDEIDGMDIAVKKGELYIELP